MGGGSGSTANFSALELVDDKTRPPRRAAHDRQPGLRRHRLGLRGELDRRRQGRPGERADAGRGRRARRPSPSTRSAPAPARRWPRRLAGTAGLTKLGPGTLVLDRPNTLAGALNVNGGTLRLDPRLDAATPARAPSTSASPPACSSTSNGGAFTGGLARSTLGGGGNGGPVHARLRHAPPSAAVRTNSDFGSTFRDQRRARSPPPTSTSAATARPPWTSTPASS